MKMVKLSDTNYIKAEHIESISITRNITNDDGAYIVSIDNGSSYSYPFSGTKAECIDYVKDLAMQINDIHQ